MKPNYHELYQINVKDAKISGSDSHQYSGLCPFHDDKKPSFSFNIGTGLSKCFAGCFKGNAYQFAAKIGVSNPNMYIDNNETKPILRLHQSTPKNIEPIGVEYLQAHPELNCPAWEMSIVQELSIGYENDTFQFSHFDSDGSVIAVHEHKGRVKGDGKAKWYPAHCVDEYQSNAPLYICEGEKDAVTLLSHGFQCITNTTGCGSIPKLSNGEYDFNIYTKFEEIYIIYDNDEAGQKGADKLGQALKGEYPKKSIRVVNWSESLPDKYDVTDYFSESNTVDEFECWVSKVSIEIIIEEDKDVRFPLTDSGNAELLVYLNKANLRFNHTSKKWLIWNSQYWKPDLTNKINTFAIQAARYRQNGSMSIEDSRERELVFKWGIRSESKMNIDSTIKLAQSGSTISTLESDWNNHPFKIQFENGVYNLETHQFSNGNPDDMITQSVGYDFEMDASCRKWEDAIAEMFSGDIDMINYMQKLMGYCISGDMSEQSFFIFVGSGANGKSVCLEVMRICMAEYTIDAPFTTFEQSKYNNQSNELARLNGARIVTASESSDSKSLNVERLKNITGGDPITARFLYSEHFTFKPECKIFLAVNILPNADDTSKGFWRRVHIIPFNECFEGERCNEYLVNELGLEKAGIMNWMIEGFKKWKLEGLDKPHDVVRMSKEYEVESNPINEFIELFLEVKDGSVISSSDLYIRFERWLQSEYPKIKITQTKFSKGIKSKGYVIAPHGKSRQKHVLGVNLK